MTNVIHAFPSVGMIAKEIQDNADKSEGIIAVVMSKDDNPTFTTYTLNFPRDTAVYMLMKLVNTLLYEIGEGTSNKAH